MPISCVETVLVGTVATEIAVTVTENAMTETEIALTDLIVGGKTGTAAWTDPVSPSPNAASAAKMKSAEEATAADHRILYAASPA